MNEPQSPVPSPFVPNTNEDELFLKEVEALRKKYDYDQCFVMVSVPTDAQNSHSKWFTFYNMISEGMVEVLELNIAEMQNKINDDGDRDEEN